MELFSLTPNITITDVRWQAYPIGFFLLFLCLFTIIGNLLILYIIIRDHTLHASKYYYIASLAFADLLIGLIVMPFAFIFEMTDDEYWLFPRHLKFLCDFWHSLDVFASTASILGLCAIGIDRYVAITKPIGYPNSLISKKWYYILSFIWICSAVISFPAVIHFGTEKMFSHLGSSTSNATISTSSWLFKECDFPNNLYYILFASLVSFYLPLIIMTYVYIKVYLAAKRQAHALRSGYICQHSNKLSRSLIPKFSLRENSIKKQATVVVKTRRPSFQLITLRIHRGTYQNPYLERSSNPNHNMKRTKKFWKKISQDQKAGNIVGLVMGIFVFCWLPYFVYSTLSGVFSIRLKDDLNHQLLFKIFSWLGYTNSALDVLIYISTSKKLRIIIFKLFCT